MRLTVFGPGHPFRGGIAATTTALVAALVEQGHEVLFATPRRQYPAWLYPGPDDRDPTCCALLPGSEPWLDPLNPLSWPASRRRARRRPAEAWIVPYWTWAWAGLWTSLLAGGPRPPAVAVVHNPSDHDAHRLQRLAARLVLRRCQGLFTHARSLAEILRRDYPSIPVASHPLAVVPAAPRLPERGAARRRLGLPAEPRIGLFLGFVRPYKGVDILLQALTHGAEGWHVVVAGEAWGDLATTLPEAAAALGVAHRVDLHLGWVPENRLDDYLAAADIVVLPYRSASQSGVAPLCLGRGRPVLSTTVGGLPEIVDHGGNGWLVEPDDPTALAAALDALDRATLDRLTARAAASVAHLTWASYASALGALVQRLVVPRRP